MRISGGMANTEAYPVAILETKYRTGLRIRLFWATKTRHEAMKGQNMTDAKKRRVSKTPSPIPTLNLRELAAGSSRKLIIALSGKGGGFRYCPLPPLRTVHTTFTVHGSSNVLRFSVSDS